VTTTTCFYNSRQITLFYSLWPLLTSSYRNRFRYTTDLDWVLSRDKNKRIVLVGAFLYVLQQKGEEFVLDCLRTIRAKYDYVALWDDNAGSGIDFGMALPFVDVYFKKHLLKDRTTYTRPVLGTKPYGATVFGEYYYQNHMKPDPRVGGIVQVQNPADLNKLRPIWNLGWGSYPMFGSRQAELFAGLSGIHPMLSTLTQRHPLKFRTRATLKEPFCSFRYTRGKYDPTIRFQRDMMTEVLENAGYRGFERIGRAECYAELDRSVSSFSPFGWGEVCFRDFESILYQNVLVKPSCDHFETFPNVYYANETYLPVRWDASDLVDTVERSIQDTALRTRIVTNAWGVYRDSFAEMPRRVQEFAQEVLG